MYKVTTKPMKGNEMARGYLHSKQGRTFYLIKVGGNKIISTEEIRRQYLATSNHCLKTKVKSFEWHNRLTINNIFCIHVVSILFQRNVSFTSRFFALLL